MTKMKAVDVLVIGGGVNGTGIARDLSGRGLSVMLCEKNDLASATSSASTKLIHGGLRYLEHGEFSLVREALIEREVLLRAAPHIIWPMTFVLPYHKKLRPWWLIRIGLFIYDHLGGLKLLSPSKGMSFAGTKIGQPLKPIFKRGFYYADCCVDDARLVVLNALDAYEKGAQILPRTECTALAPHPKEEGWVATLHDSINESNFKVHAQLVVNASGPWVNQVLGLVGSGVEKYKLRWVKGTHIIVPRIYQGDHAYILQNEDKRVVFAIPYEHKYTLIGTTESEYTGDLEEVRSDMKEVEYLCAAVNHYFRHQIKPSDVAWTYSGVRPLLDDGVQDASSVTRGYMLDVEEYHGARMLNVYGGKITTFRKLSEQAGDKIVALLGRGQGAWTATEAIPGGDGSAANFTTFFKTLRREYSWMPEPLTYRYARSYGARCREFLRGFRRMSDLGEHLGDDVYEIEVTYLVNVEWALTMEDILWRRSKLGLHISEETEKNIKKLLKKILTKKDTSD
ncbi:MAG: glycerol-3-phosphate dehydrogenase [Proteobacteria bacterium]|nr:glycerol-3-phosphate dehydrogenase [Pseudomonadota bacterium]